MDHVLLTDNDSANGAEDLTALAESFPASFLTVRSEKRPRAQMPTYAWCAEEHRRNFNWIAFLDVDEYLVIQAGCVCWARLQCDLRPDRSHGCTSAALILHCKAV